MQWTDFYNMHKKRMNIVHILYVKETLVVDILLIKPVLLVWVSEEDI